MTTAIPAVDPTDLERIYELYRAHPGHAVGLQVWVNTCTPGADFEAIGKRAELLRALAGSPREVKNRLIPWLKPDGIWSAPAFRAASKFQMTYGGSALFIKEDELEEFIQQLKKEGWA